MTRLIPMLPVKSMPASVEFYCRMLGFKVERRHDGWGWAMLRFDECRLMLDQSINAHPGKPRDSIIYLYARTAWLFRNSTSPSTATPNSASATPTEINCGLGKVRRRLPDLPISRELAPGQRTGNEFDHPPTRSDVYSLLFGHDTQAPHNIRLRATHVARFRCLKWHRIGTLASRNCHGASKTIPDLRVGDTLRWNSFVGAFIPPASGPDSIGATPLEHPRPFAQNRHRIDLGSNSVCRTAGSFRLTFLLPFSPPGV